MKPIEFEKWQALGNDYLIIDVRGLADVLGAEEVRFLCDHHFGPGADGVLLLDSPQRGGVASLRIFNPDGSEAELSGNGAREAACFLRARNWTDVDEFRIETPAGDVHPKILDGGHCSMRLGIAATSSPDFPEGPEDGCLKLIISDHQFDARHVHVGNPQLAVHVPDRQLLELLDLESAGRPLETDARFPNRTNVSFWTRTDAGRIRARIFERGVGETLSSGTGASGAAVAACLESGERDLEVELDGGNLHVAISDDLEITLTGWAVPVYAGTLSNESMEALHGQQSS